MTKNKSATLPSQPTQPIKPRFVSLRWRFLVPLFAVLLPVAMFGAYALAQRLGGGFEQVQDNVLLQSSRAVNERAADLYARHVQEARRVAFTVGVPEAAFNGDTVFLQDTLESLARLSELDAIVITDKEGREVLGVQRVETAGLPVDYAVSTGTDLGSEPLIGGLSDQREGVSGFMLTPNGLTLFTAIPLTLNDANIGVVMVGQRAASVLEELRGSALSDLAVFGPRGSLLETTFALDSGAPQLQPEVFNQAINAVGQVIVQNTQIASTPYRSAYQPLIFGDNTLGVVGAYMPDDEIFATELGRQFTALFAAAFTGTALIAVFVGVSVVSVRAGKVTQTAKALAAGDHTARTGMQPTDEVGAVGKALDEYADYAKKHTDALREALQRQRREASHLMTILESIPDGIVVQDLQGRVVLINDAARDLIGSSRVFRTSGLGELATVVKDTLGTQLAPGIYALGDPQRIDLDDRMLTAQAAAILSVVNYRIGTVIVLRDITDQVRREQAQQVLLGKLAQDIQSPLAETARQMASQPHNAPLVEFARQITKHAYALQRVMVEMGELTSAPQPRTTMKVRPLRLETLIWACANEWRQVAQASGLTLHVIIEQKGLFVLGDEKRLRWAMGNILDNAIKYTPTGGACTLEIKGEEHPGLALLRVRDNGVGILPDDLPNVFVPFYRGTPTTQQGQIIRVPGMGQGLAVAKQIFEAHGGSIKVKSQVGVGTAVYFALPLTSPVTMREPQYEDLEGETMPLMIKPRISEEL
jgi:signal transduction histidine kinase